MRTLDVKTTSWKCEYGFLLLRENFDKHPSDVYVFAYYDSVEGVVRFIGWVWRKEILDELIDIPAHVPNKMLKFVPQKDNYLLPMEHIRMFE